MAEVDDYGDLFAIDVGVDNYAETAANDAPNVSRTFQSEGQFQKVKASYTAKIDTGNSYQVLLKAVPELDPQTFECENGTAIQTKLSNKDKNLLGYTVGEMYYDREFSKVIDLCRRVELICIVDARLRENLGKWMARCEVRMQSAVPV